MAEVMRFLKVNLNKNDDKADLIGSDIRGDQNVIGKDINIIKDLNIIANEQGKQPFTELSIIPTENPSPVLIDLPLFLDHCYPDSIRSITAKYSVNRIIVRNKGNAVAENCRRILTVADNDLRVCWNIPISRPEIDIHMGSKENLDACAVLVDNPSDLATRIRASFNQFNAWNNQSGKLTSGYEANKIKEEIFDLLKDPNQIPFLIAPTENEWQHPAKNNRILGPGNATITGDLLDADSGQTDSIKQAKEIRSKN